MNLLTRRLHRKCEATVTFPAGITVLPGAIEISGRHLRLKGSESTIQVPKDSIAFKFNSDAVDCGTEGFVYIGPTPMIHTTPKSWWRRWLHV